MVRAHRQAWCWQDEWYGLTIEDIRQLELETQLALAMKMAQFSQAEEATEANGSAPSPDKNEEVKEAIGSIETEEVVVSPGGETLQPRGVLTKQWSTSSRSSRSSKRGGESAPSYHLCMCDMLKILKADFFCVVSLWYEGFDAPASSFFSVLSALFHLFLTIWTSQGLFLQQQLWHGKPQMLPVSYNSFHCRMPRIPTSFALVTPPCGSLLDYF